MMKTYICLSILTLVCLLVGESAGYNCTDDWKTENSTKCIFCKWKRLLNQTIANATRAQNFNLTVCVTVISNISGYQENITIQLTYNESSISQTYNETCQWVATTATATKTSVPPSSTTDTATTTTKSPKALVIEAVNKLENEAKDLTNSFEESNKQATVTYEVPNENNEVGNQTTPLFQSTSSNTKVGRLQVRGNFTGPLRAVVIKSTEALATNPDVAANPIVEDDSPGTVSRANMIAGELVAIDIFAAQNPVSVSFVSLDLDISQPLNSTLAGEAIKKANKESNIAESSFGRSFMSQLQYSCTFFDNDGKLNDTGCESFPREITRVLGCECNHATVFAALISAKVVTIPSGVKIISYILEVISILFLLVTAIALIKVRNRVRGDRVKVQIGLSLSLLALHLISVLHDAALLNNTTCEMWAVLTQFFLLSSAMWMLMEGLTLSFKTMDSVMRFLSGANARKFAIFRYVVSISAPAIVVLITAAIGFGKNPTTYMPLDPSYNPSSNNRKYLHCWLGEEMLLGGVVIPVAIIMSCCIVITVRMCYVVYRMSSESDNYKPTDQRSSTGEMEIMNTQHIKAALKATLVLLPVLGIPWFLGFFTAVENGGVRQTFMYLNAIVNGLQGVMLFLVYCVLGKEVRKSVIKLLIRKGFRISIISQEQSTTTSHGTYTTKLQGSRANGREESGSSHDDEKMASDKL